MTTLITFVAAFGLCGLLVLALDARARRSRRRDRDMVRRIHRHFDQLPPARPW